MARYYDPVVGRFISADTIVPQPGSSQAYDRFAYSNNNPINYTDPTGHYACADFDENGKCIPEKKSKVIAPVSLVARSSDYDLLKNKNLKQTSYNNCGPWAVSQENATVSGAIENLMIKNESHFEARFGGSGGGVKPSELQKYTEMYFDGKATVIAKEDIFITDMYNSLLDGGTVVVDIMVHNTSTGYAIGDLGDGPTFAHFARVVEVDLVNQKITLVNSLNDGFGQLWEITWDEYSTAAKDSEKYSNFPNDVITINSWMLTIHPLQ